MWGSFKISLMDSIEVPIINTFQGPKATTQFVICLPIQELGLYGARGSGLGFFRCGDPEVPSWGFAQLAVP